MRFFSVSYMLYKLFYNYVRETVFLRKIFLVS